MVGPDIKSQIPLAIGEHSHVSDVGLAHTARAFVADNALCIPLNSDVEIVFLAAQPRVITQSVEGQSIQFRIASSVVETARARCNIPAAVAIAMELLQRLIGAGHADKDVIIEAIKTIVILNGSEAPELAGDA